MELKQKINFRQPKYILPALIYIPLLFTGYFVIDMLHTKKAEIVDPAMQTTDYLNPNLPQPKVKEELEGKYESMLRSYGKIDDFSAVDNIDRDGDDTGLEQYESKYSEDELQALEETEEEKRLRDMEDQMRRSAERGAMMQEGTDAFPLTESEKLIQSQQREEALRQELEEALALLREQNAVQQTVSAQATVTVNEHAVNAPEDDQETLEVVRRIRQSSDYFHTVSENDPQPDLIKAIIDENVKAVDGSRVRLRLLDDVEIGDILMPKGSYLYAVMNGFSGQRVKGSVGSVLLDDNIIKVSLDMYDTDGLEGLYVPQSTFRETGKEVAGGAVSSNMSMGQGNAANALTQWGLQAAQNAYQRTTSAVSKAIRKNGAHLKYGTFVYLVNSGDGGNK